MLNFEIFKFPGPVKPLDIHRRHGRGFGSDPEVFDKIHKQTFFPFRDNLHVAVGKIPDITEDPVIPGLANNEKTVTDSLNHPLDFDLCPQSAASSRAS
jgi:hypothetical protein